MRAVVLGAALLAGAIILLQAPAAQAQGMAEPGTGAGAQGDREPALGPCVGAATGYYSSHTGNSQSSPLFAPGGAAYSYAGYGGSYSPSGSETGLNAAVATPGAKRVAATMDPAACTSPIGSAAALAASGTGLDRNVLASLALPSTTSIQRGTDLRDPDVWLIQTRDGPTMARRQRDGGYAFFSAPQATGGSATLWRPWSGVDRPAIDAVWQNFAVWWTDQGRAWPPS